MCVYFYEEIFSKIQSPNLAVASQTQFLGWRLSVSEKGPSYIAYIHMTMLYINICIQENLSKSTNHETNFKWSI